MLTRFWVQPSTENPIVEVQPPFFKMIIYLTKKKQTTNETDKHCHHSKKFLAI